MFQTLSKAAVADGTAHVQVRQAASAVDLQRVAQLRTAAFGRHMPLLAPSLNQPEPSDLDGRSTVLMAESTSDGRLLGTLRIHDNRHQALPLQASVDLPWWLDGCSMVEPSRLAVAACLQGTQARMALCRELYRHCQRQRVEWIVVATRSPVDRLYESLMFRDLFDDGRRVPLRHAAHLPHRIMALNAVRARALWAACRHPLLAYMTEPETRHEAEPALT